MPLDGGEELFILANGFVNHEAAHVRMTDFDELAAVALSPLAHLLFNIVEDVRVEKELLTVYPGCLDHFKKLYGELIKEVSPEDASEASRNITGWLMSAVFHERYPDVGFPVQAFREAVDAQFPNLATQLERFIQPGLACASTAESIAWGKDVEAFLPQYFAQSKPRPAEQKQDSSQGEPQAASGENGEPSSPDNGEESDARSDDAPGAGSAPSEQGKALETPGEQKEEDTPSTAGGDEASEQNHAPEQADTAPSPDDAPDSETVESTTAGDDGPDPDTAEPDETGSNSPQPEESDCASPPDDKPGDGQDSDPAPEPGDETDEAGSGETGSDEANSGESQSCPGEHGSDSGAPSYNNAVQQKSGDAHGNAADQPEESADGSDSDADADSADQDDAVSSGDGGQPDKRDADAQPDRENAGKRGDPGADSSGDSSGDGEEQDNNGSSSVAGPGTSVSDTESSTDGSGDSSAAGNDGSTSGMEPEGDEGQHTHADDPGNGATLPQIPQSSGSDASLDSSGIDMLERMIQGDATHELAQEARESLGAMVKSEGELSPSFGDLLKQILERATENWGGECLQVAVVKGELPAEMPRTLIESAQSATKVLATRLSGLLQTQTLSRTHTGRRGRVDGNRLHRLAAENPRVFKQAAAKQSINTAVHILLDCSGSMDNCMSLANSACYSVASALHRIRGVNVGVTAFPGEWDYEERCTVSPILKHGQRMHTRFAATAHGSTPMGEALWWICQQMMALKEDRKIILVLTDGYPDSRQNTEAALDAAHNLGFETIGIGIGEHGSFISTFIENSRVINDIQELAPAMFGVLQQALTERG